ncbi:hypothetical protein K488DRAFT_75142 [Vararia minispora EC-137]|uniref:Uncharacterized protein n=1 Tax=Vararia minispora EC-137 TaxID=1314806 RepID=A0ACB8Q4X3_9AGAM|nr:hypothetical protein K488DRAFT_75142 [Vararia minispora EC-137]
MVGGGTTIAEVKRGSGVAGECGDSEGKGAEGMREDENRGRGVCDRGTGKSVKDADVRRQERTSNDIIVRLSRSRWSSRLDHRHPFLFLAFACTRPRYITLVPAANTHTMHHLQSQIHPRRPVLSNPASTCASTTTMACVPRILEYLCGMNIDFATQNSETELEDMPWAWRLLQSGCFASRQAVLRTANARPLATPACDDRHSDSRFAIDAVYPLAVFCLCTVDGNKIVLFFDLANELSLCSTVHLSLVYDIRADAQFGRGVAGGNNMVGNGEEVDRRERRSTCGDGADSNGGSAARMEGCAKPNGVAARTDGISLKTCNDEGGRRTWGGKSGISDDLLKRVIWEEVGVPSGIYFPSSIACDGRVADAMDAHQKMYRIARLRTRVVAMRSVALTRATEVVRRGMTDIQAKADQRGDKEQCMCTATAVSTARSERGFTHFVASMSSQIRHTTPASLSPQRASDNAALNRACKRASCEDRKRNAHAVVVLWLRKLLGSSRFESDWKGRKRRLRRVDRDLSPRTLYRVLHWLICNPGSNPTLAMRVSVLKRSHGSSKSGDA